MTPIWMQHFYKKYRMGEDKRKHALAAWRRSLCTAWWFCILIYLQLESLNIFYLMKPYSHLWVTFMNLLRYFRYWWKVIPKRSRRKGNGWHYNIGRHYRRATAGKNLSVKCNIEIQLDKTIKLYMGRLDLLSIADFWFTWGGKFIFRLFATY